METFRIIEIKHFHGGFDYHNEFVAINDAIIPPYYDENAFQLCEEQYARVIDNNDPKGIGRVRVQFAWQEDKNAVSPWLRLIQPHSGAGKGFYFIPEIGEEVLVGFESLNTETPYVLGTQYNGAETSGFHTKGNDLKVTKTRSGHTIIMDDSEDKMSITILDQSGNMIYLDTVKKSITIQALETIDIICKNLNIKVEENMKTNVGHNQENTIGKNIKTVAKEEISQDSGKKTIIASGDNTEISARKDLDLYGKNKLIGFTDGKTEFGAKEQMHIYGTNSLITAKDKIQYKAPQMNKLPESGKFKYDKEPKIINMVWCYGEDNIPLTDDSKDYVDMNLIVNTRNYEKGESISVTIKADDGEPIADGLTELTLTGVVDENNQIVFKEPFKNYSLYLMNEDNSEVENKEDENAIYRTYEGKNYTKEEWKVFEDEQYKIYLEKRNKKGFWG
jgi:type VI secretion system secreted protein VgrG